MREPRFWWFLVLFTCFYTAFQTNVCSTQVPSRRKVWTNSEACQRFESPLSGPVLWSTVLTWVEAINVKQRNSIEASSSGSIWPQNLNIEVSSSGSIWPQNLNIEVSSSGSIWPQNLSIEVSSSGSIWPQNLSIEVSSSGSIWPQNLSNCICVSCARLFSNMPTTLILTPVRAAVIQDMADIRVLPTFSYKLTGGMPLRP